MDGVEVFVFDVFGTVVDWRSTIVNELKKLGQERSLPDDFDYELLASQWREGYKVTTANVAKGEGNTVPIDYMHRKILDDLLDDGSKFAEAGSVWTDDDRDHLTKAWHRLTPWADSVEGLHELKKHAIVTTLSNGGVRLQTDMAKNANLPWDTIFAAEMFGSYKTNPATYLGVLKHMDLEKTPGKCCMVAAHIRDVLAARSQGMRTVYIPRLDEEWDPDLFEQHGKPRAEGGQMDLVVSTVTELAHIVSKK